MKVLYLILGVPTDGVRKKIFDKALFLEKANVDTSVLIALSAHDVFNHTPETQLLRIDYSYPLLSRLRFFWRLTVIAEQRKIYRALSKYLSDKNYDVILMRYPVADFFLYRFMKGCSGKFKIVFEHNTLEEEELKSRAGNSFWYRYFFWSEKWFGKKVRMAAAGLIGVTGEIRDRQFTLAEGKIPVATISNGIDVSRVKPKRVATDPFSQKLNLLFLAGSEAPWHGVDILLNSLKAYEGPTKYHCYIAGNIDKDLALRANEIADVTLLSHQSDDDLDKLIEKCDIGVGSLALFRNNMAEACTLKVREYWARGLPFVIGYDDTDLMNNPRMQPFYLKISLHTQVIPIAFDLRSVDAFANQVFRIENVCQAMRGLATEYISYPAKAASYYNFFKSLS